MQAWSDGNVDIRSKRHSGRPRLRRLRRLRRLKASNHLGKYSRTGACLQHVGAYIRYEQP